MTTQPLSAGFDPSDFSTTIRPQDDLYQYLNSGWIERTAMPEDKARYGTFDILNDGAELAIRAILDEVRTAPEGSEARKVGDLYSSFLDEERIDALGSTPLVDRLAQVRQVSSINELLTFIGRLQRRGGGGFYAVFVENDPGDPDRYVTFFEQGGLSLPDESYYREDHFASIRDAFVAHVQRMLELAGVSDAEARSRRIFELETKLAAGHWNNVDSRDSEKTYNLRSWDDATELFGSASLEQWRNGLEAPVGSLNEVVLRQPSFTEALGGLLTEENLEAWKDWLTWQIVAGDAPYLSKAFVDEHFDFYGRTLTGAEAIRPRWKRAVALVEGAMGEAVGKIYVERHYPPEVKVRMDELVANLVEAYRRSITDLEWMGEATRRRALEKLDAFTPKIGYPVRWRDYSTLRVDANELLANVRAASEFEFNRNLAKIGQPVDRDEWFMTPQMVNAYYNPGFNEVVFPASILQPPFFDAQRDEAANYGGIGAVIGHEIGHGFDDQGSKFDGTGRLTDWWEPSDRTAFEERTKALIDQYDVLSPALTPGLHVNGALTVGENIGDLGGLAIAWKAYLISLKGKESPVIDGLTGAQRFFFAWVQTWRQKSKKEE
ncbi:MAG TPA: M13-type metalloendopeptidase, partial [Acidimicrobiales bacterium]|nr:M13-type metalloendopeptidase [Acidimicrobiales bacterium]